MDPDLQGPTVPAHPPVAPPPPRVRRTVLIAACAVAAFLGLLIGILIGRATDGASTATVAAGSNAGARAQLRVTSKPVDANVVIDGRFVGVAPVERIDLDAGKHSVVIDAFGYQPYAGTLEVEAGTRGSLDVLLVAMGESGSTKGELVAKGGGKASNATVPATALAPISLTGTGTSRAGEKKPASRGSRPRTSSYSPPPEPPRYEPPPRPRRDCGGERSQCRDSCSRAEGDCRFNCPNCVTCPSSVGWDECKRQCETCRKGCDQNVKFCQSSCESNFSSCNASQ
jgi:hypothetical protein